MKLWKPLAVPASLLLATACSTQPQTLDVQVSHLREIKIDEADDPMLRGERQRLLYGAIGVNEQAMRRGQYFTALWNESSSSGPVEVIFEYQQASGGSTIKRSVQTFSGDQTSGRAMFVINGEDYQKGGRVLAWRCSLRRGGQEVASRQSYLWQ